MILSTKTQQNTVGFVLGNGSSMTDFDLTVLPNHNTLVIGTNRWFERTHVDATVAVDDYQIQYIKPHPTPLWTTLASGVKNNVKNIIPWYAHKRSQCRTKKIPSGAAAINLLCDLNIKQIWCLGFDSYTLGMMPQAYALEKPRSHTHPINRSVPQSWRDTISEARNRNITNIHFVVNQPDFVNKFYDK